MQLSIVTLLRSTGFYSLSVLYGVVSISVFIAPVLVPKTGERISMWIGAFCYW